jgi:hypothetical protein
VSHGQGARPLNRYGITVAFWVTTTDEDDARVLVGNFIDGFPEAVKGHGGDVLLQDVELEEEDVEVDE